MNPEQLRRLVAILMAESAREQPEEDRERLVIAALEIAEVAVQRTRRAGESPPPAH